MTHYEPAVASGDEPLVAPLRTLTHRSWPSLTVRLVLMIALLGMLTAFAIAVTVVAVALLVTATAG